MASAALPISQGRQAEPAPTKGLLQGAGATSEASETKRYCWECTRRRLECDAARPVCNKCRKAGIVCPGYEDKKPLKWLAPGRVTARTRKAKVKKLPPVETPEAVARREAARDFQRQWAIMTSCGSEDKIPLVDFKDDVSDVVQASFYFNTRIYPDMAPLNYLGTSAFISTVDLKYISLVPMPTSHTMVSLAICHHIHQNQPRDPAELWCRFHHHRGLAIHELGQDVSSDAKCAKDRTVFGILMMLCLDIMYMPPNWRHHLRAITKVIALRGGLNGLFQSLPYMRPILTYFLIVGVMGTTTSPPQDYVVLSSDTASLVEMYGKGDYPTVLCPPALFLVLMKINALRYHTSQALPTPAPDHKEPDALLAEILAFSPEAWADLRPDSRGPLLLIGRIYRCAATLYCISSLRALFPADATQRLLAAETDNAAALFRLLREAMSHDNMRLCMVWPLLVAGVAAAARAPADRTFVLVQLAVLSRALGTSFPLLAREVLLKFWTSGLMDWDDCFDRPYAFVA